VDILNLIDPLEAIVARLQDDAAPAGWQLIHRLHSFPSAEEMASRNALKAHAHTESVRAANALRFQKDEDRLVVDYDYEPDLGRIGRNRVAFLNMLALAYREKVFHLAGAPRGAKDVRCVARSRWLSDVLAAWQAPLGSHDASAGMHLGRIFRHYTVFSIVGRLDVVAAQCRII
jgi:hypothetical protein